MKKLLVIFAMISIGTINAFQPGGLPRAPSTPLRRAAEVSGDAVRTMDNAIRLGTVIYAGYTAAWHAKQRYDGARHQADVQMHESLNRSSAAFCREHGRHDWAADFDQAAGNAEAAVTAREKDSGGWWCTVQ